MRFSEDYLKEYYFRVIIFYFLCFQVNNLETENVTLNKAKFEAESTAEHLAQSNNMLKGWSFHFFKKIFLNKLYFLNK